MYIPTIQLVTILYRNHTSLDLGTYGFVPNSKCKLVTPTNLMKLFKAGPLVSWEEKKMDSVERGNCRKFGTKWYVEM